VTGALLWTQHVDVFGLVTWNGRGTGPGSCACAVQTHATIVQRKSSGLLGECGHCAGRETRRSIVGGRRVWMDGWVGEGGAEGCAV